ncbi:saccharopine dehydrogenase family protein [Nocardia huaxiensis]|uniref:Saccharopine dehydrogenase NADP-binding domain-containing protein n=1 Tax=Nocardia huaxiensis TaxID=2755382 RepID=A0A7D6ZFN4_9NOCA|nr:saccharopine dehydrogenase NADP-binding domain-containing protein [Nocardia huaxiensis]QLY29187.1 saccharopine dehydrogenase NADP-binding domain-containing protein [Nocardia huaxiensis]UFS97311.1 saccharopine dehydrogenase NADP-binding domain-containing protein [Nocardia huaxiensis]
MRVLALGGAGAMGAVAVEAVLRLPGIDELVIADRDLSAAQRVAAAHAHAPLPVRAAHVDVTDRAALREVLRPADVVLNTVGPYYEFGLEVLWAAIENHTHYLDLCDDWEPTIDMLKLDAAARGSGICAVLGMGASPGISNLLALAATRRLDTVDDVYTAWPVDVPADDGAEQFAGAGGRPSAAAVHWMAQLSGTISVVEAGGPARWRPLRPIPLELPGNRRGTAYTVGHPEPVTLRHTVRPAGVSATLMVVTPSTVAYLDGLRRDIDRGRLTAESAAAKLMKPGVLRGIRAHATAGRYAAPGTLPPFFAVAYGSKDGRRHAVLARIDDENARGAREFTADMARATAIPLALGLSQLLDGLVRRPGVHAPEAVIDPDRMFRDLGRELGCPPGTSCLLIEEEPLARPGH